MICFSAQAAVSPETAETPTNSTSQPSKFEMLCHFADRNENAEGALCMALVDTDRARYISSHGYVTTLTNILPLSCTPKNNMLVARKLTGVS